MVNIVEVVAKKQVWNNIVSRIYHSKKRIDPSRLRPIGSILTFVSAAKKIS